MNAHSSSFSLRRLIPTLVPLRKWLFVALAAFAALASMPEAAAQTTVTLSADQDVDIATGTFTTKNAGACNIMYAGGNNSKDYPFSRPLLHFNLGSLPPNAVIQSATLRLTTVNVKDSSETTARNVSVHAVTETWTEGTGDCTGNSANGATWNNRTTGTPWTTAGGSFGSALATTSIGGLGQYSWSGTALKDLAQNWYNGSVTNNGLLVKYSTETAQLYKAFATRTHATTSARPELVITYTTCTGSAGGASAVCVGGTANVTPSSGGTWSSSDNAIATVTNAGVVTGVSGGAVTLTFTETGTGCQYTRAMTVTARPVIGGGSAGGGAPNNLLNYEFYDGSFLPLATMPTTGALGTGTVGNFDVAALQNIVDPGDGENYGIRYRGYITVSALGTYTFYMNTDDRGRIYVNGTLVVDNDQGNTFLESSGTIILSPGSYPITVEFTEYSGDQAINASYSGPSIPKQTLPFSILSSAAPSVGTSSLNYEFYDGTPAGNTVDNIPTTGALGTGTVANFDVTALQSSVDPGDTDSYAIRYTGYVNIPTAGSYTFYTSSDDGSKLYINGTQVVNNDGDHPAQEASGTISLTAGWHAITIPFYNSIQGGVLSVSYEGPSISKQVIPSSVLSATLPGSSTLTLCAGATGNLTPSSGGTWTSSNNAAATVTNGGVVTGVAAGSATLTFTDTTTGCSNTIGVTVTGGTTLGGATAVCVGSTANVTPSTGGTWSSSNNAFATVTNAGVVTGVAEGTVTLTFTDTASGCQQTRGITVAPRPQTSVPATVCVGSTVQAGTTDSGTWTSSNNAIATVSSTGVITGVSAGTADITLTTNQGCSRTRSITVTARPTLGGASTVCAGQTANVTPSTGGTWTSSNSSIATINNSGVVTGVSGGTVTLTFTSTATGCSNTRIMQVNAGSTLGGASSTCVGIAALVTPSAGGTWSSSDNAVATVTNAGVVTGVGGGSVTLSFTNTTTGCVSTKAFTVSVPLGGGGQGVGGATAVCVGFQTNVTPASGGVWSTSNASVATVTNAGLVTGFSSGTVVLTFTETATGCVSSVDFDVYPNVVAGGANSVCQGAIANVTPTTNGTWVSSNPAIAFVNNSGFVTGLQPGTVTLTFTSLGGCSTQKSFTVHPKPTALGAASVQVGQTANVTPATGGVWVSSNNAIATVTNLGVVTGVTEGTVTLTFTDSVTGCSGSKPVNVADPALYKNRGMTDSGNKVDPNPLNNEEPEVVFPQSWTSLIVTVFQDINGDGTGDQPVSGVTITLRDAEGEPYAVVTTGSDGSYTFNDLPIGFYTVTQTVPNGNFTLGDNPMGVSIIENTTQQADFVNSQLGQISGTILADAGDEAMPNVLVSLLDENGDPVLDSSNQPITTTTNSGGFYLFDRVPPGTYQVQQTVPSGFTAVDDVDGTDFTINGDVTPIVIAPGTVITNQDFVNFQPGSITGNISIDTDLNLAGDAPHVGVTVALLDGSGNPVLNGSNQPITTVTDASGNFSFPGLNPGNYRVAQTVPSGYTAISDSDGGSFTVVGDVSVLAVAAGESQTANFTNQPQTDIAVDKSVSNSTPVVGTNVTFTVVVTNNGPQNATDVKVDDVALGMLYVSHVAGQGTFALTPGAPANTFSGLWTVGALNVGQSATLTVVATVTSDKVATYKNSVNAYSELGDPNPNNNTEEVPLNPVLGSISGNIKRDTTGDNLGDVNVAGVALALIDDKGNPVLNSSNVPLTTLTDASGNYSFAGLPPGSYRVVETVPAGDVAVNDVDGGNRTINGDVTPITLTAGQALANQDFVIAQAGSIAGTITNDTTGDTVGDSPLANVVVVLLQTNGDPVLDGNGDPIITTTDVSGNYLFSNLLPGNYRVGHVPPGGMIGVDDIDGGLITINGDIAPISVLPGLNVTGQNFVDSALGFIGGSVFADSDADGDGDSGIANVTIALVNSSNITIATAITNSSGGYLFANVPPGTYTVVEAQPTGYSSVSDVDGGDLNIIGDIAPIVLLPNSSVLGQNFVEILNATITGIVLNDTNNDDIGDAALPGVTVTLRDPSNNIVATTTSGVDGTFSFPNLIPGTYTVVETDPSGYTSVTPNSLAFTLLPGTSAYVPYTDEQLGSIGGVVNADTTGNGTGDTPLPGVTVTLLDENNQVVTTTTSGVDGSYSFPNLPPGDYTVVETDPSGYTSLTPNSVPVALLPGETETVNFTDTQNGSISGTVLSDTTGDGIGDTPLPIVTVTLLDENNQVVTTTTSGVDGSYSFPNLPPGDYTVVETDPQDYISLTPNSVPVLLLPGENEIVDFTDAQFATISGNVFNDSNRLTDNLVNGTGTNAGGIYINLVNPTGNLVIASIPVAANGTYSFTQANGVNINSNYLLVLTPTVQTVGNALTTSTLPTPWLSTGENLGAGVGSDGTPNGILAVSTTVGALAQANFGIVPVPDVAPVITAQPNVMNGPTDFNIRVQVTELNAVNTEGLIVVRIPKDTRWNLREVYNPALTSLDGVPMENNKWAYTENATQHIFTTINPSIVIPSGGFSYFGIKARWVSVNQEGIYTISAQIDSGSGNENRINNNSDAEKVDFFNK